MLVGWTNSFCPLFSPFQGPSPRKYLTHLWLGTCQGTSWPRSCFTEASQLSPWLRHWSQHWPIWLTSQPRKWKPGPCSPESDAFLLSKQAGVHGSLSRCWQAAQKPAHGEDPGCLITRPHGRCTSMSPASPLMSGTQLAQGWWGEHSLIPELSTERSSSWILLPSPSMLCHTYHGH